MKDKQGVCAIQLEDRPQEKRALPAKMEIKLRRISRTFLSIMARVNTLYKRY